MQEPDLVFPGMTDFCLLTSDLILFESRVSNFRLRKEASRFAKATPDKPPRPTVPGLTEVLVEMAEKNGSKVLRLYAMQHLSLWFGKERDPAKRRAMVGLLEKLAITPGDETAGCAVLMLADVRRQVSSFKWGGE